MILQLQSYIIHSLEMLVEIQILRHVQTNQIRMATGISTVNKQTRVFLRQLGFKWDVSRPHPEKLSSFVFVVCCIKNSTLCIHMCFYMNNCFRGRITE